MENAGLVLLVPVLLGAGWVFLRQASRRRPLRRDGVDRRTTDEVRTVLVYTAPGAAAGVQRAVVAHLGLPARAPSAFDPVTYVQADGPGGVVIAYGTAGHAQFTGGATFGPTAEGGTTGAWEIRRWATQDGAACSADVVAAMVVVRTTIADAVRAVGGTAVVHVLDAEPRPRS